MKKAYFGTLTVLLWMPAVVLAQTPVPSYPPPAEVKAAFLKLLDRPKVPLDVKVQEPATENEGLVTEHLSFATEKKADGTIERVPVLLVRPADKGRHPAVLALHGTGGNKEGQRELLRDLAKRNIIGIAIDGRYFGERAGGAQ